jgi:single-strand DNA-binding protein
MSGVNKVIIIGHLGKDAEVRYTQTGQACANFSVAASETWRGSDGEKKERTEWVRVVLWGKPAEALKSYLVKGKQVYVEGRLQTREWEKDGRKHYATEVVASQVTLLGGGGGARRDREPGVPTSERESDAAAPDDIPDIPF